MSLSSHRRALVIAFTIIFLTGALTLWLFTRLTPYVRDRATASLESRFQSDVELQSLDISVFPRPKIAGSGLTFRHRGRTDVPPLITVGSYSASAGLAGLLRSPLRLRTVELDRLELSIPPGGLRASNGEESERSTPSGSPKLIIDQLVSRAMRLEIVPRDPGKMPRIFEIHDLVMRGLGEGDGAAFQAALTNPTPRGEITTHGRFGPWRAEDARRTPLSGEYAFRNANLDTIKGIGGTLSSQGRYTGVLERIDVRGETETPDFSVDLAAQPVPLKTRFHAVVDGTSGDTYLEQVEARVLETVIGARGAVVRAEDVKGRRINLDVIIEDGRIEDVLKLAVKSARPLMTGRMQLKTTFLLPAGDRDVIDKLELAGSFSLDQARFTNVNIQERINELSQRGKGRPTGQEGSSVVSRLSGTFTLRRAALRFANLSFGVPGAVVQLAGTYDIKSEVLDFRGNLLLDATLEKTTTGFKAILGRIAQPLFRRPGGGSRIPIQISGPREKPRFGLDVKRVFSPG